MFKFSDINHLNSFIGSPEMFRHSVHATETADGLGKPVTLSHFEISRADKHLYNCANGETGVVRHKYITAHFYHNYIHNSIFGVCTFINSEFYHTLLDRLYFADCTFDGCSFSDIRAESIIFVRCTFVNCTFANADMPFTKFRRCEFKEIDVYRSNFFDTEFYLCDFKTPLRYGPDSIGLRLTCPEQGSFTAYKKVYYDGVPVIVELRVPANAKRSSATSNKCRCSKAKVISFTTLDGEPIDVTQITNYAARPQIIYEIGKVVKPDRFDPCRWNECSHGIHFFINRQEAVTY